MLFHLDPASALAESFVVGFLNIKTVPEDNNNNCKNQRPYNRQDLKNRRHGDKSGKGAQHAQRGAFKKRVKRDEHDEHRQKKFRGQEEGDADKNRDAFSSVSPKPKREKVPNDRQQSGNCNGPQRKIKIKTCENEQSALAGIAQESEQESAFADNGTRIARTQVAAAFFAEVDTFPFAEEPCGHQGTDQIGKKKINKHCFASNNCFYVYISKAVFGLEGNRPMKKPSRCQQQEGWEVIFILI